MQRFQWMLRRVEAAQVWTWMREVWKDQKRGVRFLMSWMLRSGGVLVVGHGVWGGQAKRTEMPAEQASLVVCILGLLW